jgi:hypothetical protein
MRDGAQMQRPQPCASPAAAHRRRTHLGGDNPSRLVHTFIRLNLSLPVHALQLLGIALFIVYGFHPIKRWRYRHIPGPRPRWLVGNLLDMLVSQVEAPQRWGQQYGPIWCFWLGAVPVVMTNDPHIARLIAAALQRCSA